ncbi:hypothetical protein V6N13_131500 [Hibiscus sabdariffa]|uniref:Terpene synthase metal-binding domain-containing protein n=1 Tax=Hibiscus sabdariffa TaxID=183260 RepID=A0ABR2D9S7_9ROSI
MYYKPTLEEFKDDALPTSVYAMLAITALVGMGDVITLRPSNGPSMTLRSSKASTIAEHKFNHRREDDIECYMEQYGVNVIV